MTHTIVGVDIAKSVMQIHWVDPETGEVVNRPLKRAAFLEYFANRSPCLVGMESCGGSQHWAPRLIEMGHQVKLMPAKFVKAFVMGNKNDAADARAIWMAAQQPGKSVAVKTETQQAVLGPAPDAGTAGEIPDDADQQSAWPANRIRRSDGQGSGCAG